ncbi:MAG: hypothetical protein PVI31_01060 [Gemmatimonadota bacterium]
MSRNGSWRDEEVRVTSEVARRAIRRLNVFEWVILGLAMAMAIGGGALVAWVAVGRSSPAFRTVWMVASLVVFIVPGIVVIVRHRREEREDAAGPDQIRKGEDD